MIFARNIDSSLTSLVKKIDAATKENSSAKMGSFVVFLASDDDAKKMEVSLPEYAKKKKILSLLFLPLIMLLAHKVTTLPRMPKLPWFFTAKKL